MTSGPSNAPGATVEGAASASERSDNVKEAGTEIVMTGATVEAVNELARMQAVSPVEALLRAIGRERLFLRTVQRGGKILIEDPVDHSLREVLVR